MNQSPRVRSSTCGDVMEDQRRNPWVIHGRRLFILQFGITSTCNLRCRHCYDDTEEHVHMPFDQCVTVLDKFFAFCRRYDRFPLIWLTGGEPTIHPHFWDILTFIKDEIKDSTGGGVVVLSNGFNADQSSVEQLADYPIVRGVQISVDGACAETHDTIRGKGSFARAAHALRLLEPTPLHSAMHFVVHKDNYQDAFKMTDLAREWGVDTLVITRLVPWGRGQELYKKMLSPEQVQKLYRKLDADQDALLSESSPPKPNIARERCDWPVIYFDPSTPESLTRNGLRCGTGSNYINVMENGDVYPCRRMPIRIGNILEEELIDIWQHPLLWKLREKSKFMQGKCNNCFFCVKAPHICSGGASCIAYAVYRDPFQPDPQCGINPLNSPAGV